VSIFKEKKSLPQYGGRYQKKFSHPKRQANKILPVFAA
jgi:hypothetical protein